MLFIQFELRFHELINPTAQGDVRVAEYIGVDRVHRARDLKPLAFELLIRSHGIAVVGLSKLLGAVFLQRRSGSCNLGGLALNAARGSGPSRATFTCSDTDQR
ncbi:hypothetical protein D3C80_1816680 [compost metagenome]